MSEAVRVHDADPVYIIPSADVAAGEVVQLPDGRAAIASNAITSGIKGAVQVCGEFDVTKTASIVMLDGCEVWWDSSAGAAILRPPVPGNNDFYLGVAREDAASAATTVRLSLNAMPSYLIQLAKSAFDHVPVLTAGTPVAAMVGGALRAAFSATAEAQKLDALSIASFPVDSDWIFEAIFEVVTNGDADVVDVSIGVANDTHASDADSIAQSCFIHLDPGADLDIMAESDDDDAGEVAATDTTVNWAVGTAFHVVIDGRDPSDIQIYIDGVLVLGGSTFTLAAAAGPLKALFHVEKSANDSPFVGLLHEMTVRTMDYPSP